MERLFKYLPTNPSKWVYFLLRRWYTLHLLQLLMQWQYPCTLMGIAKVPGRQLIVGYSSKKVFFIHTHNRLAYTKVGQLIPFTYHEFYDYRENAKRWVDSEDGKKILAGIVRIRQADHHEKFLVTLKGRKEVVLNTRKMNDTSLIRHFFNCRHHMYMLLFWEGGDCRAYLPHEMVVKVSSPTH